jgi:diacylglycerol kinase family enzyme
MRGIVFVNPSAGPGASEHDDLQKFFAADDVFDCRPEDLADRVRAALTEGRPWIGVAGGDGTLRAAAEQLLDSNTPLLPIPAGTRNHFAKELHIDSLEDAALAASGAGKSVDVGQVNDQSFLNNSSIGLYPKVVVGREAHERKMPKRVAQVVAIWEQVRHGHRFRVTVDGRPLRAWMVFVGNGCYGEGLFDLIERQSMTEGVLDVRVVRADRPLARTRIVFALLVGRLSRSPLLMRETCEQVEIDMDRTSVEVALDGEVEELAPPLRYRSRPKALRVLAGDADQRDA